MVFNNVDWDDVLAYSTTKVVRIRSAPLGLTHRLAQACIFLYIVVYQIIFKQGYLKLDNALGDISLSVRRPVELKPIEDLDYCQNGTVCTSWPYHMSSVTYLHSILVGTRVTATNITRNAACGLYDYDCEYFTETGNETILIGQAEDSTIQVEHAISAGGVAGGSSSNDKGHTITSWDKCDHCKDSMTVSHGKSDIMTLQQILDAAGLELDEKTRHSGRTLLVRVMYNNTAHAETVQYYYEVKATDIQAKSQIPYHLEDVEMLLNIHGIKLVFLQAGGVGMFDFQTMLMTLVTGLALLASATTMADLALTYVLPDRKLYYLFKYAQTPDFKPDTVEEQEELSAAILRKQRKLGRVSESGLLQNAA